MRKTCTINEVDCDKIVQYRQNMATKAALKQPNSLEFDITDNHQEQEHDAMLLDQSIRNALPDNLITYYDKLLVGDKVPARTKKQIREIATGVINDA
jgi:hypothetical protein